MRPLDEIGREFGTDKAFYEGRDCHDYLRVYDDLFGHLRGTECRILEIGVRTGASLRMWEVAFPKARIVGVDIDTSQCRQTPSRVALVQCDVRDRFKLADIACKYGPFEIVIDDGAHTVDASKAIIETLFVKLVSPGGHLIIEDLNANQPAYGGGPNPFANWAFEMARLTNLGGRMHWSSRSCWPPASSLEMAIDSITYRAGLMILKRA